MSDLPREEQVFESTTKVSFRRALGEFVHFREVFYSFARRTLKVRYKQAVLGIGWVVLQPLATLGLFSVVLGRFVKIDGGGAPYAVFVLSALVGWQFVANAVPMATGALVTEAGLMRKVYFPREAPVLGSIAASLVDAAVTLGLFMVLGPILGAKLGMSLLALPLVLLCLVAVVVGLSLPFAALMVYFRDLRFAVPILMQMVMFASPVVYPLTQVPERWRTLYSTINPLVGPLDGLRRILALGKWPDWSLFATNSATAVVLVIGGYWAFKRMEAELADVV